MSLAHTLVQASPRTGERPGSVERRWLALFSALVARFERHRRRARSRAELARLNPHLRRDLGHDAWCEPQDEAP